MQSVLCRLFMFTISLYILKENLFDFVVQSDVLGHDTRNKADLVLKRYKYSASFT